MLADESFDFSFSGLKTAVLYYVKSIGGKPSAEAICDIVASFQDAVVDILVEKTFRAAAHYQVQAVMLAGGVASNSRLREKMGENAADRNVPVFIPSPVLCTDNAAMIAAAGEYRIRTVAAFPFFMNALSRWPLTE
jgi:N6-L-threonylcarbamoyladenine synthase